jgi:hypothetical protein
MPVATQHPTQRTRYPLERGWTRWKLIRELAVGEQTPASLARKYGVDRSAIAHFGKRHAAEIEEVRAEVQDELVGLWITQKAARLAEYQQDLEDVNALMALDMDPDTAPRADPDEDDPDGAEVIIVGAKVPALLKAKARLLHQVAEEMGHLPARVQVQVNDQRVSYSVEGVDLSQLR